MEMEEIRKKLGERIRVIRKARGLTQEGLGEKAGLSYKFIGEIERGQVNPSLDTLASIADVLGVGIKDFFQEGEDLLFQFSEQDREVIKKALGLLDKALL